MFFSFRPSKTSLTIVFVFTKNNFLHFRSQSLGNNAHFIYGLIFRSTYHIMITKTLLGFLFCFIWNSRQEWSTILHINVATMFTRAIDFVQDGVQWWVFLRMLLLTRHYLCWDAELSLGASFVVYVVCGNVIGWIVFPSLLLPCGINISIFITLS